MEKRPSLVPGHGMILGKFLPPHAGHQYLIDFALNYVEHLMVVVGTLESEPIPGRLRYEWMREMFPRAEVLHLADENPQEPHEHPRFWEIWHDSLHRILPIRPDYIFASEGYGFRLADMLGARYIPVDHARALVPVSGREIRQDPMKYWSFLPETVRPYYVRRICIMGPESTGKSILAGRLARRFATVYVSEYARGLIDLMENRFGPEDFHTIARGQISSEEALARQANRVLICDTDAITTMIYSELFYGDCPQWIRQETDRRSYDLYLLTDPEAPWVDDPQRFFPEHRKAFFERCRRELESRGRSFVVIGGSWEDRYRQACQAVEDLIGEMDSDQGSYVR